MGLRARYPLPATRNLQPHKSETPRLPRFQRGQTWRLPKGLGESGDLRPSPPFSIRTRSVVRLAVPLERGFEVETTAGLGVAAAALYLRRVRDEHLLEVQSHGLCQTIITRDDGASAETGDDDVAQGDLHVLEGRVAGLAHGDQRLLQVRALA